MNYNENKNKIKSLSSLIENILNQRIVEEQDEELKAFLEMIAFDEYKDDIERLKIKLIPFDLFDEVAFYVEKQFKGNWSNYFKTVQIYFDSFSFENLVKCNIQYSRIYEEATTKGKRKLNRERKHNLWHASVLLKLTGKSRSNYSCNTIFNEFKQAKKKEVEFIKNGKLIATDGKVLKLKDCTKTAEQSIAEKINLLNVQEKIAEKNNWTWCFITLTLKGEYHPNPSKGKNTYNGMSPRDSARLLNEKIKNVRSLMAKRGIKAGRDYIGCSSAEAHKDGCLHKHLLVFCDESMIEKIKEAFFFTFENLNDDSFRINNGQAKASSYVFKYVMKSIESYAKEDFAEDREMKEEEKNAILNNAFRSYNFIRGFSFFGIENCLTKFRFIARNIKEMKLPTEIEVLVKENNLFELLTKGFFDMFENIYAKDEDSRVFMGVKFNGNKFLKRFFSLVKNASETMSKENIANNIELAVKRSIKLCELIGVILNHNYSRNERSSSKGFGFHALMEKRLLENIKYQINDMNYKVI